MKRFEHSLTLVTADDETLDTIGQCECEKSWRSNSRSEVCDEWIAHVRYLLWLHDMSDRSVFDTRPPARH